MPGWGRLRFWNGIWKAFPFVRSRHCAHASKELAHVFIGVSFRLLALQPLHSRLSWGGIHARRRLVPDRPEGHACSSCTRSRTGKVTRENSFLLRLSGFRHAIARVACAAPSVVLWSLRVRVHALGTADKRGRKETLGVPIRKQRRSGRDPVSTSSLLFRLHDSQLCDEDSDETRRSHSRLETVVCADMR